MSKRDAITDPSLPSTQALAAAAFPEPDVQVDHLVFDGRAAQPVNGPSPVGDAFRARDVHQVFEINALGTPALNLVVKLSYGRLTVGGQSVLHPRFRVISVLCRDASLPRQVDAWLARSGAVARVQRTTLGEIWARLRGA